MKINNNQGIAFVLIIVMSLVIIVGIYLGKIVVGPTPLLGFVLMGAVVISLITLVNTDAALIILIFSMLLSPELSVGTAASRAVVIRLDDFLLIGVFFTWLAKTALSQEYKSLKLTPLGFPILGFILICFASTFMGIVNEGIPNFKSSFFYILKYVEYFILYFMVYNNLRDLNQIKKFVFFIFITCLITCGYAISQIGQGVRVSAPFEGVKGEPNTLAGYLVFIFALAMGVLLYSSSLSKKVWLSLLLIVICPAFLFTLSRGGYVAFIAMYLILLIFTKQKKLILAAIFLVSLILLPQILPASVTNRVLYTFTGSQEYAFFGQPVKLEPSAAQRVEVWKSIFDVWQKKPIFGYGITGVGLMDNQWALLLGEMGLLGIWFFSWMRVLNFKIALFTFKAAGDEYIQGLSLGYMAGLMGLLVHSFAGNIFIIVRIMEPFWFMSAVIVKMSELVYSEAAPNI